MLLTNEASPQSPMNFVCKLVHACMCACEYVLLRMSNAKKRGKDSGEDGEGERR